MKNEDFATILVDKNYQIISASREYFNFSDEFEANCFTDVIDDGVKDFISTVAGIKGNKAGYCILDLRKDDIVSKYFVRIKKTRKKRATYEILIKEVNSFFDSAISSIESFETLKNLFTSNNCLVFNLEYKTFNLTIFKQNESLTIDLKKQLSIVEKTDSNNYEKFLKIIESVISKKTDSFEFIVSGMFNFDNCLIRGKNIVKDGKLIRGIGVIEEFIGNDDLYKLENLDFTTDVLKKETVINYSKNLIDIDKKEATLMIMDLDNFKEINDTYGHLYGDKILYKVANIFKKAIGKIGYVGRIGGDEFMAVIPKSLSIDEIRNISRPIRLEIQFLSIKENLNVQTSCSIGIARYPIDANSFDELFKKTDRCLYVAKEKGKNKYIFNCEKSEQYQLQSDRNTITAYKNRGLNTEKLIDLCISSYKNNDLTEIFKYSKNLAISNNIDRLSLYYGEGLPIYKNFGCDTVYDNGMKFLDERHLSNFDEFGYYFLDNAVGYEITDNDLDQYYKSLDIKSAMQYLIRDNENKIIGLISVEKNNTATSWRGEIINEFIMMAKTTGMILKNK